MRSRLVKLICMTAAMLLTISLGSIGALADESYSASQMRLLHYEGEVEILNADGESRFVLENVRFDSGETLITGEGSLASIELDEDRIVTLDEKTSVEFIQEGDSMKMNLLEGIMLLDVQDKLDENETLDIQTSNMTVGIRGTAVYVVNIPAGDERLNSLSESTLAKILPLLAEEGDQAAASVDAAAAGADVAAAGVDAGAAVDGTVTVFGVINGNVDYTWIDNDGAEKTINVAEGSKAILIGTSGEDTYAGPVVAPVTNDDVSKFIDNNLSEERSGQLQTILNNRNGSKSNPYSPNAVWSYCGLVTLVAQSASKMYDGTALTEKDILVSGLPESFEVRATTSGSQTDAGTSDNPVSSYSIFNYKGEDVTSHFVNVETVSGQLVVDPQPLTVQTEGGEKVYNGAPLTVKEAELKGYSGLQKIETGQNISYINTQPFKLDEETEDAFAELGKSSYEDEDQGALYGAVGQVVVHGTNPLTGETKEIVLNAGEKLLIYINENAGEDEESIEFKIEMMKEEEIPLGLLQIYADNPDVLKQACKETGWDIEKVQELIDLLPELEDKLVTENGLNVRKEDSGATLQDYTNVWINVDSDVTDYDQRALDEKETKYLPVTIDESITVKTTGSQTDVGESENTYEIDWGTAKEDNYILSEDLGTLKVTPAEVKVTTGSAEKTYDGTELTSTESTITGLAPGETATVITTGTQTDAGSSNSTYTIEWGTAKADNYTVTDELGTLTVNKADVTITTGSAEKAYDGKALTSTESSVEGLAEGESVTITTTGSQTKAGSSDNTYTIEWDKAKEDNYTVTDALGTLTVTQNVVTVSTGSAEKAYDGKALTSAEFEVTGMAAGEEPTITTTGTITTVGEAENTYTIDWGEIDPANYTVTDELGTLKVTQAAVTISTGSDEKTYDGKALTSAEFEVTGLAAGEEPTITTTGTITTVGEAENTYTIDWGEIDPANYTVTEELGTLKVTQAAVTISTGSDEKTYDGKALTSAEFEVTGLAAGEEPTITTTGTITDVGEADNTYTIDWGEIDPANYTVTEELGTLKVTQAAVTISTGSDEKTYDGTPLTSTEVNVTGLAAGEEPTVTTTGTITAVGEAENTYTIDWGEIDPANYTVTDELGTLKVTPAKLTFDLAGKELVYSGETNLPGIPAGTYEDGSTIKWIRAGGGLSGTSIYYAYSLFGDDEVKLTFEGYKDAGTYTIEPEITFPSGSADNYEFTWTNNTMVITKAAVTFSLGGKELTYWGQGSLPDDPTGTFADGTSIEWTSAGGNVDGTSKYVVYSLLGEDQVKLAYQAFKDAGTYTIEPEVTFPSGSADNYEFTWTNDQMVINKREITVTTNSSSKEYDGTALTGVGGSISNLVAGEEAEVIGTGTITDVGSTSNTYTISWGSAKESNYVITEENLGTLTITVNNTTEITFTSGSGEKTYDGTPLRVSTVTATGLPSGFTYQSTAGGNVVYTDAGEYDNSFTPMTYSGVDEYGNPVEGWIYAKIFDASGKDVTDNFKNQKFVQGTLTIYKRNLTVTTSSASKAYDFEPLTSSAVTLSGLADADSGVTATASGSQTGVGSSSNRPYTINWGTSNSNNYQITSETYGTLTINAIDTLYVNARGGGFYPYEDYDPYETYMYFNDVMYPYDDGASVVDGVFTAVFSFSDGTKITVTISGWGSAPGTYELNCNATPNRGSWYNNVEFKNTTVYFWEEAAYEG